MCQTLHIIKLPVLAVPLPDIDFLCNVVCHIIKEEVGMKAREALKHKNPIWNQARMANIQFPFLSSLVSVLPSLTLSFVCSDFLEIIT